MDQPIGFGVEPLAPALGAEIKGLDLGVSLPEQTIADIRRLWNRHIVLVFRDQDLSEAAQLRFAARFGTLGKRKKPPEALKSRVEGSQQTDPNVILVTNKIVDGRPVGAFGDGDMWFHIDSGYAERPYKYTFLHALELPSHGGNTRFANMYRAYETLPEKTRQKLAGKQALHIHEYKRSAKVDISGDISNVPHHFHPVCITHPETGRKSLFVDRLMTARIEGLDEDDSRRILEALFDHAEQHEFVYEHVWRLGDVVMWDNRCATHGQTYFPKDEPRLLRRCTIEGEMPVE